MKFFETDLTQFFAKDDTRRCAACGSDKTYVNKRGYANWRKSELPYFKGWLCQNCFGKLCGSAKYNPRRILLLGRRIYLKFKPRTGICCECGKQGLTNLCFDPEQIGQVDINDPEAAAKAAKEYCIKHHKKIHKVVAEKLEEYYEGISA